MSRSLTYAEMAEALKNTRPTDREAVRNGHRLCRRILSKVLGHPALKVLDFSRPE